ncbi:unnamed protein product, partial [Musa textilis]
MVGWGGFRDDELIGCSFRGVPWRPWHRTPAPPRPGNACGHARPLCASGGGGKALARMTSPCARSLPWDSPSLLRTRASLPSSRRNGLV